MDVQELSLEFSCESIVLEESTASGSPKLQLAMPLTETSRKLEVDAHWLIRFMDRILYELGWWKHNTVTNSGYSTGAKLCPSTITCGHQVFRIPHQTLHPFRWGSPYAYYLYIYIYTLIPYYPPCNQ